MKKEELMSRLGLNKYESQIYLSLLESGATSIVGISEKTGIHRPIIYKLLPGLIDRNLVAESWRGKRKVFIAESPTQLKKLFSDFTEGFECVLPELMQTYGQSNFRPVIKYFTGKKGVTHVFEDILSTCKKGDVFYRYESPKNYQSSKKYVPKEYLRRFRDNAEVERFIITNEITQKRKIQRLGRLVKIVPPKYDLFAYNITQMIYGDKVAFVDYDTETALIIESAMIAKFQKQLFKLLWGKI